MSASAFHHSNKTDVKPILRFALAMLPGHPGRREERVGNEEQHGTNSRKPTWRPMTDTKVMMPAAAVLEQRATGAMRQGELLDKLGTAFCQDARQTSHYAN